jgi:hypothetical protein
MPDKLPRLFEVEWQRANIDDAKQKQLLAFIAFARKGYTLSDLSRVLDFEEATIRGLIQNLKFIIINQQNYEVNFVSESFRKFVSTKLQYLKDEVYDFVISDCNYSGLLRTCQRRGNQLKYTHDARRRTASPSRRKSHTQSVGS